MSRNRDGATRASQLGFPTALVGAFLSVELAQEVVSQGGDVLCSRAERWQVVRMILGQGGRLALAGVTLGALAAAGVARVLDSLLYGVSGLDPAAYGAAAGVLLLVALAANLVPAVTAARVDPVRTLRNE